LLTLKTSEYFLNKTAETTKLNMFMGQEGRKQTLPL